MKNLLKFLQPPPPPPPARLPTPPRARRDLERPRRPATMADRYATMFFYYEHFEGKEWVRREEMTLAHDTNTGRRKCAFRTQNGTESGFHGDWAFLSVSEGGLATILHGPLAAGSGGSVYLWMTWNWKGRRGKNIQMLMRQCKLESNVFRSVRAGDYRPKKKGHYVEMTAQSVCSPAIFAERPGPQLALPAPTEEEELEEDWETASGENWDWQEVRPIIIELPEQTKTAGETANEGEIESTCVIIELPEQTETARETANEGEANEGETEEINDGPFFDSWSTDDEEAEAEATRRCLAADREELAWARVHAAADWEARALAADWDLELLELD